MSTQVGDLFLASRDQPQESSSLPVDSPTRRLLGICPILRVPTALVAFNRLMRYPVSRV